MLMTCMMLKLYAYDTHFDKVYICATLSSSVVFHGFCT
jgi:hypothetical protein